MNEKRVLRKKIGEQLGTLSKPLYEHFSHEIAKSLYSDPDWKNSQSIAITISKMPEVDTYQIIRKAWEENKQVVVPKCNPSNKTMDFRKITAFNQLESVFYGLYEPIEALTVSVPQDEIDLVIVPGLAFTRQGFRLGFGGGYYDRYLMDYKGQSLSLAFSLQIQQTLPIEKHDIPVHKIITELGSFNTNG